MIVETCPNCGEPLMNITLDTYPPIPKKECWKCGWSWTGNPEEIEYKPFEVAVYQEEADDKFVAFLKYFVFLFENGLNTKLTIDILYQESGTGYWLFALKKASKECAYEIAQLWEYLPWWAADLFDEWIIKCIDYMGLIKEGEKNDSRR